MHRHQGKEQDAAGIDDCNVSPERVLQDELDAAVAKFTEYRSAIEQTKGMLMLVYGINEAAAFELLRWRSQHNNVKLRVLAVQIAADFLALSKTKGHPLKSDYDNVLLNAHQRIQGETPSRDGIALSGADQYQLALKTRRVTP
jgi:hypothetical protein